MPSWMALNFQDSGSLVMTELFCFHDHVMTVMLSVVIVISYTMIYMLVNSKFYKFMSEGTLIETIWSMIPAVLLMILVLPSMKVLYMIEDIKMPVFTIKIMAHQWYWTYIFPYFKNISILNYNNKSISSNYIQDSNLLNNSSLTVNLMQSDYSMVMPVNCTSRLLISSSDVIHSFSIPTLGLKVDALPGRINQLYSNPSRVGLYFGQCSEICGTNHSFMPINLKVCSINEFENYLKFKTFYSLIEN